MRRLLLPLSERYLFEIAEYFSALELPYTQPAQTVKDPTRFARARRLIVDGDPALGIPGCSDCHGERLTGIEPGVPGLLGLPRDYINAQLGAWRNRQRQAGSPDCMAQIAEKLTLGDVSALSTWLSSQPLPADTRPAAAMPIRPAGANNHAIQCAMTEPAPVSRPPPRSRGEYLARIGNCAGCHTPAGGSAYEGGRAVATPFGLVYASNLTPDRRYGIGRWSSDDFWKAMKTGISRDKRLLSPAFPYANYSLLTRADSDELFEWLQTQPAVSKANRPTELRWPYNTQLALWVWRKLFFKPVEFKHDPVRSADWNRGAYLVQGLGHCGACHTPRNPWGAADSSRPFAGAAMPASAWYAPSLIAESQASLKVMPLEEAALFLQSGRGSSMVMMGPMAEIVKGSLQYLSAPDAIAMATYLSDLPGASTTPTPLSNVQKLDRGSAGSSNNQSSNGAILYERYCADCHGRNGDGRRDAENKRVYSSLAGNRSVTMSNANNVINNVLHGGFGASAGQSHKPFGMPPFLLELDDAQAAMVINYIRNAWGNSAAGVNENEVARNRGTTGR